MKRIFWIVALIGLFVSLAGSPAYVFSQPLAEGPVTAITDISRDCGLSACNQTDLQALQSTIAGGGNEVFAQSDGNLRLRPEKMLSPGSDGKLPLGIVEKDTKKKYYCVQPNNPTPEQVAAFEECRDELPDCDRRKWVESGDGSLILVCTCNWIFSSC